MRFEQEGFEYDILSQVKGFGEIGVQVVESVFVESMVIFLRVLVFVEVG